MYKNAYDDHDDILFISNSIYDDYNHIFSHMYKINKINNLPNKDITALSACENLLALGFSNGQLYLGNLDSTQHYTTLHDHTSGISSIAFNENFLGTSSFEGYVNVYHFELTTSFTSHISFQRICTILHPCNLYTITFCNNFFFSSIQNLTQCIATGGSDNLLRFYITKSQYPFFTSTPFFLLGDIQNYEELPHSDIIYITSHPILPIILWGQHKQGHSIIINVFTLYNTNNHYYKSIKMFDCNVTTTTTTLTASNNNIPHIECLWIDQSYVVIGFQNTLKISRIYENTTPQNITGFNLEVLACYVLPKAHSIYYIALNHALRDNSSPSSSICLEVITTGLKNDLPPCDKGYHFELLPSSTYVAMHNILKITLSQEVLITMISEYIPFVLESNTLLVTPCKQNSDDSKEKTLATLQHRDINNDFLLSNTITAPTKPTQDINTYNVYLIAITKTGQFILQICQPDLKKKVVSLLQHNEFQKAMLIMSLNNKDQTFLQIVTKAMISKLLTKKALRTIIPSLLEIYLLKGVFISPSFLLECVKAVIDAKAITLLPPILTLLISSSRLDLENVIAFIMTTLLKSFMIFTCHNFLNIIIHQQIFFHTNNKIFCDEKVEWLRDMTLDCNQSASAVINNLQIKTYNSNSFVLNLKHCLYEECLLLCLIRSFEQQTIQNKTKLLKKMISMHWTSYLFYLLHLCLLKHDNVAIIDFIKIHVIQLFQLDLNETIHLLTPYLTSQPICVLDTKQTNNVVTVHNKAQAFFSVEEILQKIDTYSYLCHEFLKRITHLFPHLYEYYDQKQIYLYAIQEPTQLLIFLKKRYDLNPFTLKIQEALKIIDNVLNQYPYYFNKQSTVPLKFLFNKNNPLYPLNKASQNHNIKWNVNDFVGLLSSKVFILFCMGKFNQAIQISLYDLHAIDLAIAFIFCYPKARNYYKPLLMRFFKYNPSYLTLTLSSMLFENYGKKSQQLPTDQQLLLKTLCCSARRQFFQNTLFYNINAGNLTRNSMLSEHVQTLLKTYFNFEELYDLCSHQLESELIKYKTLLNGKHGMRCIT